MVTPPGKVLCCRVGKAVGATGGQWQRLAAADKAGIPLIVEIVEIVEIVLSDHFGCFQLGSSNSNSWNQWSLGRTKSDMFGAVVDYRMLQPCQTLHGVMHKLLDGYVQQAAEDADGRKSVVGPELSPHVFEEGCQ